MSREPLAFPTGDPGSVLLFDDGTHGDRVAGDGIYSFDRIATRKGDYEGWNTWYQHYRLPSRIGIRVLVMDIARNYGLADTSLLIRADAGAEYDAWRATAFSNVLPEQQLESADPDRDGRTNYEEFIADTAPEDSAEFFTVAEIKVDGEVKVTVRSSNRRSYTLQYAAVFSQNWEDVLSQINLPGTGELLSLRDLKREAGGFYRVKVSLPLQSSQKP